MTADPEVVSVRMRRPDLEGLPEHQLPAGFDLRLYRPGEEQDWYEIHVVSDRYNAIAPDLHAKQFGTDQEILAARQYFLRDMSGKAIGTASAWFGESPDDPWGRVHWVAIVPAFQGRGLAKPLLSAVCRRLKEVGHRRAFLTTQTPRLAAIGLYLKFGFSPEIRHDADRRAWRAVRQRLPGTALDAMEL